MSGYPAAPVVQKCGAHKTTSLFSSGEVLRATDSSGSAVIFLLVAEEPFHRMKYTTARTRGMPTPSPTPKPMARVEEEEVVAVVVVEVVEEEDVLMDTLAVG